MKKINFFIWIFLFIHSFYFAQVGIGTGYPNTNAILELSSTNKGLILPRMALTATNNPSPMSSHIAGMTVYNTATNTSSITNAVYPGEYYNDGTRWMRLSSARETRMLVGGTITDQLSPKDLVIPNASTYAEMTLITLPSFTLDRESIVEFNANISTTFTQNGAPLTDNSAKLAKTFFVFTSAPSGIPTDSQFGSCSQLYSNGDSTNGNVIVGYYYMTPRSTLTLPAGNYTVAVKGGGASDRGYTLTFGEGTADQIQIKATPVK